MLMNSHLHILSENDIISPKNYVSKEIASYYHHDGIVFGMNFE